MNKPLEFAVVIPARFESSRLPGKPLIELLGKPMIQHVWERCCQAVGADRVYIATDDERIEAACMDFSAQVIMTSYNCLTGTDRLAEANRQLQMDFLVNVQGDEPLVDPADINTIIEQYRATPNTVINAMCAINGPAEHQSLTVPKVVASPSGNLLYMSRSPIPLTKKGEFVAAKKQVCIYAFSREHLEFFAANPGKTPLEQIEDIEILRFLENDIPVKMIEVAAGSLAIDVADDIPNVLAILERQHHDSAG
jgi:3-deoxy-manno-octulosonate cytidylyltransferase (CMP-KDO synthetase)